MAKVTFHLLHKESDVSVKDSPILKDIVDHVRNHINVPQHWYIEEREDNECVNFCNADYFIHKFPVNAKQPVCISDAIDYVVN